MARGNQREKAREKNLKEQAAAGKKSDPRELRKKKEEDAQRMRDKQAKAEAKKEEEAKAKAQTQVPDSKVVKPPKLI